MLLSRIFTLVPLWTAASASTQSLFSTLNSIGATHFAQAIQANSTLLALYSTAKTVYAIPDASFVRLVRRDATNPQTIQMHSSAQVTNLESLSAFPGAVSPIQLPSQDGQSNSVVSQSNLQLTTINPAPAKRWGKPPANPVFITSGLGNQVNIIQGDIAFDSGLIHIVNG